ncbi:unnamed protein product [Trichogramma brassicae]|uniref:Reverse transcriptase domain-containing protein n=1 Tax=Trichogramma brassicae TaxID=86971 RepID=A0A6H5IWD1_9HYME|nr:unnamed protein product [Trichogramma brassicae]
MRRLGVQGLIFFYLVNLRSCATPSLDCRIPFFRAVYCVFRAQAQRGSRSRRSKIKEHTALKIAVATRPDIFLRVFTACMRSGVFPRFWKRQKLVLLLKPGKPFDDSTSFRPICMLDVLGNILEKIVCDRLQVSTKSPFGLSDSHFGFRIYMTYDTILLFNLQRSANIIGFAVDIALVAVA